MLESCYVNRKENVLVRMEETLKDQKIFQQGNKAFLSGFILESFQFAYEKGKDEVYYKAKVVAERLSGTWDVICVVVSQKLLDDINMLHKNLKDWYIEVGGELHSMDSMDEDNKKSHLEIFVFAKYIHICKNKYQLQEMEANLVYLEGFICSKPYFKVKVGYNGDINIAAMLVAVNRPSRKADYIPCVAWDEDALYAKEKLDKASKISFFGRVQSRKRPLKKNGEEVRLIEVVEVSIIEIVNSKLRKK